MKRVLSIALLLVVSAPSTAFAFKEFRQFGLAPVPGPPMDPTMDPDPPGGGGRYFTGSLSDGYTCAVCHFGGPTPELPLEVEISPDPLEDGYRSGTEYQITVTLPFTRNGANPTGAFAGNLEIVDLEGRGAGTMTVMPDLCDDGVTVAAHLADLPTRQVAGVDNCGATVLRTTWTAPETSTGPVWLNVAAVYAYMPLDTPDDDDTSTWARIIPPLGGSTDVTRVDNACHASPGRPSSAPWLLGLVALGALLRRTRRS
ncbi:MAG: hypothetical protein R3B82_00760 [Sandaracinaceae bacterium]